MRAEPDAIVQPIVTLAGIEAQIAQFRAADNRRPVRCHWPETGRVRTDAGAAAIGEQLTRDLQHRRKSLANGGYRSRKISGRSKTQASAMRAKATRKALSMLELARAAGRPSIGMVREQPLTG